MDYIDTYRERFGVEPICRALRAQGVQVTPSGYHAARKSPPSRRALHDAAQTETFEATFFDRHKAAGSTEPARCSTSCAATGSPVWAASRSRGAPWCSAVERPWAPPVGDGCCRVDRLDRRFLRNALDESVIGLYKTECVRRDGPVRSVEDLELATASWVHWCSTRRLHSKIGNVPPVEYEQSYYAQQTAREDPVSGEPSLH